jgi:hypothetical protein
MAQTLRERLDKRFEALRTERTGWDAHCRDIAEHMLPRRSRFMTTERNRGSRRDSKIINSTATRALRTFGAGMAAGVTSPVTPWFTLGTRDPGLKEFGPVKQWLRMVEDVLYAILAAGNFYQSMPPIYEELGAFGTAALFQDEDYENVCRFYPFTFGEFYVANDARGKATTFFREFQMTVEQMVGRFGAERCSDGVKGMYDRGDLDNWITVRHAVEPYSERYEGQGRQWTYMSTYWEPGRDQFSKPLSVKGYPECPVHCPRWWITLPDVYGRSPAMEALGDVKQLQQMERRKLQGIDRNVMGPTQGPPLLNREIDLRPGSHNAVGQGTAKIEPVYAQPVPLQDLRIEIQAVEERINRCMFVDLFLMLQQMENTQPITAREVQERHEEKLLMLGPGLTQVNHELIAPTIDRVFNIMVRASQPLWPDGGMIPPPPPEIAGEHLKVDYISSLQQAQRAVRTVALERFVQFGAVVTQLLPEARDKLDGDQALDEAADMLGIPAGVVRPDDQVKAIRDERKAAEQAAQQQQMALAATQGAKNLGQSNLDGTALGALAGTGAPQGAPV